MDDAATRCFATKGSDGCRIADQHVSIGDMEARDGVYLIPRRRQRVGEWRERKHTGGRAVSPARAERKPDGCRRCHRDLELLDEKMTATVAERGKRQIMKLPVRDNRQLCLAA